MMSESDNKIDEKLIKKAQTAKENLLSSAQTIGISILSQSEDGKLLPDIGFAPFIQKQGCFYIYSSHLSSHIRSLLAGQPAQFFLIADEGISQNIWARVRLKFYAQTRQIARDDADFDPILDAIGAAHGPVIDLIRNFTDFHLFEISAERGVLVTGFAAAFEVEGPSFDIVAHLRQG